MHRYRNPRVGWLLVTRPRCMRYDSTVNLEGSPSKIPRTASRRLVLVVEDDPAIRTVIGDVLEDRGFRVLASSNGAEALQQLDFQRPDIVVLDLLMPVMHGWDFMEAYVEKTGGAAIPIVVVSVNPILPRSYDRLGVRVCIGKPFQVDELVRAVEEAGGGLAA